MDAMEAILTRRSTRKMKPDLPPRELIEKVIEAGRAAPSGSNSQTTHLIVITSRAVLSELVVTANRKGYGNAMADSACALENMMIAANALDLGSCWINQLHWLDEDESVRTCMEHLGLGPVETITGGLILGYGCDGLTVRGELERTGNPVTWVGGPEPES